MGYKLDTSQISVGADGSGGLTVRIPNSAISADTAPPAKPPVQPPVQPPVKPQPQTAFKVGVTNPSQVSVIVPWGDADLTVFAKATASAPVNVQFAGSGNVYSVVGIGKDINGNPTLLTAGPVLVGDATWSKVFNVSTLAATPIPGTPPVVNPPVTPPVTPPVPPPGGKAKRSDVLGCYFYPNPGTSETNPSYEENLTQFTREMGVAPKFINTFCEHGSNPVQNDQDGSQYWWANPMKGNPHNVIPVCGVVSSNSWDGTAREQQMRDVIAGRYDQHYIGAVQAWRDCGFQKIALRIDWEMNGTFMSWNWIDNKKQSLLDAGIGAFRHIAQLAASVPGITVRRVWNPCAQTWMWCPDEALYPGDDVVDVMGLDLYSSAQWKFGGPDARLKSWAADVNNRIGFWDYSGSFGLLDHFAHCAKRKKPWALCETGTGFNPNAPDTGQDDDPAFPAYLAQRYDAAPTPCEFVNVWSLDTGDGKWDFMRGKKPLSAKAWRKAFGDGNG